MPLRTAVYRALLPGALLLVAACADLEQTTAPADDTIEPAFALQANAHGDDMSELARGIPGFGGLYIDSDGTPTIWMTNPGGQTLPEAAIRSFLRRAGIDATGLRVRKGAHDWNDLETWFARANDVIFDVPGAVFVDLDEASNRLTIGVSGRGAAARARAALALAGVPDAAAAVIETEPIQFAATLRERVTPRVGGLQIHFGNFLCTLGFNARDGSQNSFITNSHCTNTQGGVEGTVYFQPLSSVDGTSIGTEVEDPQYQRRIAGCPNGRRCRRSDSSRALYNGGIAFTLGGIAQTALGSITITGGYTITGEGSALVGQTVNKVGRTTGRSQGVVTNTCVTTGVSGSNIVQICQTFVNAAVAGGDSGSNVFRIASGSNVTLVGLLWGSNSAGTQFVFSPIANIEQELGALTTF